jgi:enterochelin esterase-like enzyme
VQFNVDGLMIADPGSPMPKPQRQVNTSLLEIPGDPPTFLETRGVLHGTIRAEVYPSKVLNLIRPLLVYTPPGYDQHPQESYPVVFQSLPNRLCKHPTKSPEISDISTLQPAARTR